MSDWIKNAVKNLLPLSIEKSNLKVALAEWEYAGMVFDHLLPAEVCQLCGQQGLRYHFQIVNKFTGEILFIGSECILKFCIRVLDETGKLLIDKDAAKKVRSDKYKFIADVKKTNVINAILHLAKTDHEFEGKSDSFISYYENRGAFTSEMLLLLIWRLTVNKIKFNRQDFRLTIKKKREKDQIIEMPDWKIKKIWPCLSEPQRDFCRKHRNRDRARENNINANPLTL